MTPRDVLFLTGAAMTIKEPASNRLRRAATTAARQSERAERAEADVALLRAQMQEVDEVLTDLGWHTDRGLLERVRAALAATKPKGKS